MTESAPPRRVGVVLLLIAVLCIVGPVVATLVIAAVDQKNEPAGTPPPLEVTAAEAAPVIANAEPLADTLALASPAPSESLTPVEPERQADSQIPTDVPPSDAQPAGAQTPPAGPTPPALSTDTALAEHLLGKWTTDYHGTWVCELKSGDSGKLSVEWDWAAMLLYGAKIDFDITWKVEDGKLVESFVTGTPVDNYEALVRDYGDSRTYEILETSESQMKLRSTQDNEISIWKRVE